MPSPSSKSQHDPLEGGQRNQSSTWKAFLTRMPLVFPILAGFHLFLLGYAFVSFRHDLGSGAWAQVLWLLAYTMSWAFVCLGRKWAAFAYWGLMVFNLLLLLVIEDPGIRSKFADAMGYLDVVFSLVLLVYYKRWL